MRKKILSALLALMLIFSVSTTSLAETAVSGGESAKISKDDAKKTALQTLKNHFEMEIDEKKYETRVEYRPDYEIEAAREYVWEISYQYNDNNNNEFIQVSINANTGKVIRVNKHQFGYGPDQTPKVSTITEEQAKGICEKFINKINPQEIKSTQYVQEPMYDYGYPGRLPIFNFRYVRLVNGLKFDRNYIVVGVNGSTGKVENYSCRWDELKDVPAATGVIDGAKALEAFRSNTPLITQYIPVRNKFDYGQQPQNVKIVYAADFSKGNIVDAKDGKMLDYSGKAVTDLKVKDLTEKEKEDLLKSAVPVEKSSKEIDKTKAESIVKEKINEIFGSGYEIESMSYMENNQMWESRGRNVWNAQFVKKGSDYRSDDRGQITLEATTGELIAVDRYMMGDGMVEENFQPKITWDEAYNKALKAAAKYFPSKIKDIKTEQVFRDQYYYYNDKKILNRMYNFSFQRTVNGIPYNDNAIFVEYDAKTGEMRGIRCIWDDKVQFPDTKGILSKKDAEKIYFETNSPELVYTYVEKAGTSKQEVEMKLVYRL
ncbi:MAG: PepSY domain-containing protein, partial [Clostridia bacterium]|nr:PepSY domain-containing protein [Clostridia bacterium]